ncbi:hypothetical protein BN977_02885 [Mycolicibacterium cosmeticum]|uniref:Uncharacterized protein n=1 Tax=Mycolicibacterium cosmeticum TaxID=258533 RepID=W9AZS3_MYCCO|nr:hypothetical protein BN977_02885 [Mycolicibacterium cosmeticum]
MGITDDFEAPTVLAPAVQAYLAQERSWWRMLRATGVMSEADSASELARWLE